MDPSHKAILEEGMVERMVTYEEEEEEECALGKENVKTVEVPVAAFSEQKEKNVALQPEMAPPLSRGDEEEDVHVNIVGTGGVGSGFKGVEDNTCVVNLGDETESSSSSSFGDTGSGFDTPSGPAFSDSEVESEMREYWTRPQPLPEYWTRPQPPRRRHKRVTPQWRRLSAPIRWRCKWIELKIRQLDSQAQKYEKELAELDSKKQLESLKFAVDDFGVKSVPRSDGIQRNKVMKRKKRRRAEECDFSSYMSSHPLFSYYVNKDPIPDACLETSHSKVATQGIAGNAEEIKLDDMWASVDHEDTDKSLLAMIQEVEGLLSQVGKLKTRVDNVSENSKKFASVTQSSMIGQSDGFNHSGHNSASLTGNENTLSTREPITPVIETTRQLDFLLENTKDQVLMQNQTRGGELHDFENARNLAVENSKDSVEEQQSMSLAQVSDSDMVLDSAVPEVYSTLKACSTSKSNIPKSARSGRKKPGPK